MRQQQLVARKKRAFRPKTTVAAGRAEPNRIANVVPERPNQIWVSDITYVATAQGWLYLAVILDLFSRRVVGWKLDDRLEATLVHQALQNALVLRQPQAGLYFPLLGGFADFDFPFRTVCPFSHRLSLFAPFPFAPPQSLSAPKNGVPELNLARRLADRRVRKVAARSSRGHPRILCPGFAFNLPTSVRLRVSVKEG
jgi:hypothetical protein